MRVKSNLTRWQIEDERRARTSWHRQDYEAVDEYKTLTGFELFTIWKMIQRKTLELRKSCSFGQLSWRIYLTPGVPDDETARDAATTLQAIRNMER